MYETYNFHIELLMSNERNILLPAVDKLLKVCKNIVAFPLNPEYRKIKLDGEAFRHIFPADGAFMILFNLGFEEADDALILPSGASLDNISKFTRHLQNIQRRLNNADVTSKKNWDRSSSHGMSNASPNESSVSEVSSSMEESATCKKGHTSFLVKEATATGGPGNNCSVNVEAFKSLSVSDKDECVPAGCTSKSQPQRKTDSDDGTVPKRQVDDSRTREGSFNSSSCPGRDCKEISSGSRTTDYGMNFNATPTELLILVGKLRKKLKLMLLFEFEPTLKEAKKYLPIHELLHQARKEKVLMKESSSSAISCDLQDCLLFVLLAWFKADFFSWFDKGFCNICQQDMDTLGYVEPTVSEKNSGAHKVELYKCNKCGLKERFPRYFEPFILLSTRRGRCMEWASCFTLFCRVLGMDTRYVWDETDHVWVEVYSNSLQRWIHADPCENKLGMPLMYERGWGKKLSYIFAVSKDEVVDVIARYTSNMDEVIKRRTLVGEDVLAFAVQSLNRDHQARFGEDYRNYLEDRRVREIATFFEKPRNLEKGEFEGRLSGSLAWRISRGETRRLAAKSYTFEPCPKEIISGQMELQYSCTKNEYSRPFSDFGWRLVGWENGVYKAENVFRKQEKDWKMVYICREEGVLRGTISWKFDWASSGLKFFYLSVTFKHQCFESGMVDWQLHFGDKQLVGDSRGVVNLSRKEINVGTSFVLSASLVGGEGNNMWQHAQLFRQKDKNTIDYPFIVSILFEEGVTSSFRFSI